MFSANDDTPAFLVSREPVQIVGGQIFATHILSRFLEHIFVAGRVGRATPTVTPRPTRATLSVTILTDRNPDAADATTTPGRGLP